jgi:hypothetical protein
VVNPGQIVKIPATPGEPRQPTPFLSSPRPICLRVCQNEMKETISRYQNSRA